MKMTTMRMGATLVAASLLAGCNDKGPAPTAATSTPAPQATPSGTPAPPPAPSATPGAAATGAALPGKSFDCGAKGQKLCPMQAWMKSTMASASSSGDGDRLAKALTYAAGHAPPGFDEWTAIAREGATKARADDVEGAKDSCKKCHDKYKDSYKATMRDRPY